MITLTRLLTASAIGALLVANAQAEGTDLSFPVHDIIITSNMPAINLSVRNVSASTDPAQRELRLVSPAPTLNVTGQVWCKTLQSGETDALRAQVVFGNANIVAGPNGADLLPIGPWSQSGVQTFAGTHTLENFAIEAPLNLQTSGSGGVNLAGFNAVDFVESRMAAYVQQGAGSEADFMRVDDVFETTIRVNAVGWCHYQSNAVNGEYAGLRWVEVPVHVFYHADPDIQDTITAVNTPGSLAAPVPSRARDSSRAQPAGSSPPARTERPTRVPRRTSGGG